jgi:hypothetical protein
MQATDKKIAGNEEYSQEARESAQKRVDAVDDYLTLNED